MTEKCFNLFLYGDDQTISDLGFVCHELCGSDEEKLSVLLSLVDVDFGVAIRSSPRVPLSRSHYEALQRLGDELKVFEGIFQGSNAPSRPLVVVTPVVHGKPYFEARRNVSTPTYRDDYKGTPLEEPGMMVDWLQKYTFTVGFDLPLLVNDDYFLAIRLLYNNRHFVSCNKLLMSCVDTLAFVDAGDVPGNFQSWLDAYADLASLSITSGELWEFRNSLLHMTNLSSRKVLQGQTASLVFYVGSYELPRLENRLGAKYVGLKKLIDVIAAAISKWARTYNSNRDKFADFVMRYDLTVSDSRLLYHDLPDPFPSEGAREREGTCNVTRRD